MIYKKKKSPVMDSNEQERTEVGKSKEENRSSRKRRQQRLKEGANHTRAPANHPQDIPSMGT